MTDLQSTDLLFPADAAGDAAPGVMSAARHDGPVAVVAIERSVDRVLDYALSPKFAGEIEVGQRVRVPLGRGNSSTFGYVVDIKPESDHPKLKSLIAIDDDRVLVRPRMMELARWIARYYVSPLGMVLESIIPSAVKKRIGLGYTRMVRLAKSPEEMQAALEEAKSKKRRTLLSRLLQLKAGEAIALHTLAFEAETKIPTALKLRREGFITVTEEPDLTSLESPELKAMPSPRGIELNADQAAAVDAVVGRLDRFSVNLLFGVTGSGKTEVYLRTIERVVAAGRQAIVLVPEIALTPQTVRRFVERFPNVAVLHSALTNTERHQSWQRISSGQAQVTVGARSAIFAPTVSLGLIVVDEEHESSYKQDTVPRYNARDVAIKRGQLEGVPVILGSATPSLETWANVMAAEGSVNPRTPSVVVGSALADHGAEPVRQGGPYDASDAPRDNFNAPSGDVKAPRDDFNAPSGDVEARRGSFNAPLDDVEARRDGLKTNSGDVRSISGDLKTIPGNARSILGDLKTISGDVRSISGDLKTIPGNARSISGDLKTISGDVRSISGDLKTISGDVRSISGDLKAISGDVRTFSGDVRSIPGDVRTFSDDPEARPRDSGAHSDRPESSRPPVQTRFLLPLPNRVRGLAMPKVEVIDMRIANKLQKGIHLISRRLEALMLQTFAAGEQAILLLNRRGYANCIFCSHCNEAIQCKYCDTTMTYHRAAPMNPMTARTDAGLHTGQMHCHYCLAVNALPATCPQCGKKLALFGLGTQRVEEELKRKFPDLPYARVDSDTMRSKTDYEALLGRFGRGEIKLMLGTQMIAKGLDYPNVTLVGVISGDTALSLPDFRSAERTFQLVTQMAGRAGRGDKPGRVILQTFLPEDVSLQAAVRQDFEGFAEHELKHRAEHSLPPSGRMVRVVLRDQSLEDLHTRADKLATLLNDAIALGSLPIDLRGPMPCPIERIAGYHRSQIVLTCPDPRPLQRVLAVLRKKEGLVSNDKVAVDVDPVSML